MYYHIFPESASIIPMATHAFSHSVMNVRGISSIPGGINHPMEYSQNRIGNYICHPPHPSHYRSFHPDPAEDGIMSPRRRRIVDGFTFYNELHMLYYRLSSLYAVVDYFILVEATLTHAGNPKPLYYDSNKHLFAEFEDKIIHVSYIYIFVTLLCICTYLIGNC